MKRLIFNKKHDTVVVDFSGGWLKTAVAVDALGQQNLEPFIYVSEFSLDSEDKPPRKEFNRLLWSILKKKPEHFYVLLSRKYATVRFLKLPSIDEREIANMIEFQALKELPFSKDEIVAGYKISGPDNEGYSRVMLAVAQKNIIDNMLGLFKAAGITPNGICLSTENILNWFLLKNKPDDSSLYILVDVDSFFSELLICRGREALFTRCFDHGAAQETDSWINAFKEQIRISYISFKKENPQEQMETENIFLSGAISEFSDRIKTDLSKEFNVPVKFCGYSRQNDYPVSLSAVIGMIYSQGHAKVNLMPSDFKLKRLLKKNREELIKFYTLICFSAACIFVLIGARFLYKSFYVNHLDSQLRQLASYVKKAELVEDRLKIARAQSGSDTVLEALKELYSVMPQNITISSFSADDYGLLSIRGVCESMSGVFDAAALLEKSARFKGVKIVFTNKRKLAQKEIVDFQVNFASERQP